MQRILSSFGLVLALSSISFAQTSQQQATHDDAYASYSNVSANRADAENLGAYAGIMGSAADGERGSAVMRGATNDDLSDGDLYAIMGAVKLQSGGNRVSDGDGYWNAALVSLQTADNYWDNENYAAAVGYYDQAIESFGQAQDLYILAWDYYWYAQLNYVDAYYLYSLEPS